MLQPERGRRLDGAGAAGAARHLGGRRQRPARSTTALYYDVTELPDAHRAFGSATRRAASQRHVKTLPPHFDASRDTVDQFEATSSDGTKIPYFVVHPKGMKLDGSNPTILYAYGGFQISMTPAYSADLGKLWLERGGVYVLANIRGGGEFGPAWHEAALKTHRQRRLRRLRRGGQGPDRARDHQPAPAGHPRAAPTAAC